MAQIPQVRKTGPRSYPAAQTIVGGQVIEGRAASVAGVAADASVRVIGVALNDAVAVLVTDPVGGVLNTAPTGTRVNVAHGDELPVTYAVAAAFGDALVAAANGQVRPYRFTDPDGAGPLVADTDPRAIIGRCTELAGVAAGAVGLAWIY
ncbi:hypothetical protein [Nocardioides sp.]|uniref:hypothetical protein n=1 Tax=Nocardioides sp. TaxID=35761 RepID=UPI002C37A1A5|nr:hypothetical protein [Nocardioides sp.]HXH77308.1 hypothetical protein [Nocardioides sp.]